MKPELFDATGKTLCNGRYAVQYRLGIGGMGTVYKATDNKTGTDVVLKIPKLGLLEDPEFSQRFDGEIEALIKLRHPAIVRVLAVARHRKIPIAVMAYLTGGTLKDRQEYWQDTNAAIPQRLEWLSRIADALDYIHAEGYIHRDIKPDNILFDDSGKAYLSDFGIAKVATQAELSQEKLTATGIVLGTPEFMAPELIIGSEIDGRIDQYALAVTVYETLCGQVPFSGANPTAVYVAQTTQIPTQASELNEAIPESLSEALRRGLAKNPEERFPSCSDFAKAILGASEASSTTSSNQGLSATTQATSKACDTFPSPKPEAASPSTKQKSALSIEMWILAAPLVIALTIFADALFRGISGDSELATSSSQLPTAKEGPKEPDFDVVRMDPSESDERLMKPLIIPKVQSGIASETKADNTPSDAVSLEEMSRPEPIIIPPINVSRAQPDAIVSIVSDEFDASDDSSEKTESISENVSQERLVRERVSTVFPGTEFPILTDFELTAIGTHTNVFQKYSVDSTFVFSPRLVTMGPGKRAAMEITHDVGDFDLTLVGNMNQTGIMIFLFGWDGDSGYLLYNFILRTSAAWYLETIENGTTKENSIVELPPFKIIDPDGVLTLSVKDGTLSGRFNGRIFFNRVELPDYRQGQVIFGTGPTQYGQKKISLRSIRLAGTKLVTKSE